MVFVSGSFPHSVPNQQDTFEVLNFKPRMCQNQLALRLLSCDVSFFNGSDFLCRPPPRPCLDSVWDHIFVTVRSGCSTLAGTALADVALRVSWGVVLAKHTKSIFKVGLSKRLPSKKKPIRLLPCGLTKGRQMQFREP